MVMMGVLGILRELLGWADVLVSVVGAALCVMHLSRSKWVAFILAGFAAEALVGLSTRLVIILLGKGVMGPEAMQGVFVATSLVGLVGHGVLVAGVAGLLMSLSEARPAPH